MGVQIFSLLQFMTFAHGRNAYHEWIACSVQVSYCVACILSLLHSNLLAHCVQCESSLTVQFQRKRKGNEGCSWDDEKNTRMNF